MLRSLADWYPPETKFDRMLCLYEITCDQMYCQVPSRGTFELHLLEVACRLEVIGDHFLSEAARDSPVVLCTRSLQGEISRTPWSGRVVIMCSLSNTDDIACPLDTAVDIVEIQMLAAGQIYSDTAVVLQC